ncbi:hypothetical protein FHS89_001190 [Rubricella aquisinus]|uniref:Uncharacterized protein n=1 Tax=Rubricella aquisinus TaxID=2028108 RepID=A0A840WVG1_9RHOB|nr:hypothetical protein [Rubricella aquisinus]MBB5515180.1 hypothetical protein [Rubricella aquisinus]
MTKKDATATPDAMPQRDKPAPAEAYLDLWEKSVSLMQRDGPKQPPRDD